MRFGLPHLPSLPLDDSWRLRRVFIDHAIDASDFVDDAGRYAVELPARTVHFFPGNGTPFVVKR
jgi:hypothetical protein